MPLLHVKTNVSLQDKRTLATEASAKTAQLLGKPENYVMVIVDDNQTLIFAGSDQPAAYIELKSINLPESETAQLSSAISELINSQTKIEPARIYIEFSNAQRHMWGWNGATF